MKIMICGGAGYIGAHMNKMLHAAGHQTVVFDNLATGHQEAVKWGELITGELLNKHDLQTAFKQHNIDAVMHFSARSLVAESCSNPSLYFQNNVVGTLNLLDAMREAGIDKFIFSSTAAIFGNPISESIDESHPKEPINPYGRSKLMVEHALQSYAQAYSLNSVALRYFNAAGADPEGELGENHEPETHLIPNILKAAKGEPGKSLTIFGNDYPTRDGTCVRDYVHVNDLCSAHLLALEFLETNQGAHAFNLGSGSGYSVMEVLNAAQQVVGQEIPYTMADRRAGDPATLIANSARAQEILGWQPKITDINEIVATAWGWIRDH